MCAQNFNSAPKISRNEGFQQQILHFWTRIFQKEEDFPTEQNLGKNCQPLANSSHDTTGSHCHRRSDNK